MNFTYFSGDRLFKYVKSSRFREITIILSLLAIVLGLWGFLELTDEVLEGEILTYDEWILVAMRTGGSNEIPAGPVWLPETMRNVTALGSKAVLIIVVISVAGFLLLRQKYKSATLILLTAGAGVGLVVWLKNMMARARPEIISHLVEVTTRSYPSGHAMMSAVIYLSLASMLAHIQKRKRVKIYSLMIAILLTFLVGTSRVYLGVHYPSDVLAGWAVGLAWASLCWLSVKLTGWRDLHPW